MPILVLAVIVGAFIACPVAAPLVVSAILSINMYRRRRAVVRYRRARARALEHQRRHRDRIAALRVLS